MVQAINQTIRPRRRETPRRKVKGKPSRSAHVRALAEQTIGYAVAPSGDRELRHFEAENASTGVMFIPAARGDAWLLLVWRIETTVRITERASTP